jgi:hypothetical protein
VAQALIQRAVGFPAHHLPCRRDVGAALHRVIERQRQALVLGLGVDGWVAVIPVRVGGNSHAARNGRNVPVRHGRT